MIKLDLLHIYDFILELYFFTHFYRSYFPFIQSSMKIMYIFFSYSVHNFNLNKHLVKILFSIKIILWFFTRFEYLLLLRKLKSNYLSFSLLLLEQIPFCPSQSSQENFYLTGNSGMWKTSFDWTEPNLTGLRIRKMMKCLW